MKVFVTVRPGAKHESILKLNATHFAVSVTEPPKQGKANHAVMRALAEYFNVSLSRVRLISGMSSRSKMFDVEQ